MPQIVEPGSLLLKGAKDVMAMSPSEWVEAALQDLEAIVAGELKDTFVDFNQWVCVDEDTGGKMFCSVCYAGAAMLRRFGMAEDPLVEDDGIAELAPTGLTNKIRSAANRKGIDLGAHVGSRYTSAGEVANCIGEWLEALNQLRLGDLRSAVRMLMPLKERHYDVPSLPYTEMHAEARNWNNDLLPDAGVWCSIDGYDSYPDELNPRITRESYGSDTERRTWELGCIPHFAAFVREVFIPELKKVGW